CGGVHPGWGQNSARSSRLVRFSHRSSSWRWLMQRGMSGSRWIPSGGRLGCNGARSDDTEGEDRHIAVRDEECTTDAIGRVVAGRARSAHALNQRKGERSMNRKLCLTVVSSMALLSFAANAEPGHPRRIGPTREATLLGFIHQTNQNEIALAKLAQQNSS